MMAGKLFIIDGLRGAGKRTQIELLKAKFGTHGVLYSDVSDMPIRVEQMRKMAVSATIIDLAPTFSLFCSWAIFSAHVQQRILPAIRRNELVILSGGDSSIFARHARDIESPTLSALFAVARHEVFRGHEPCAYLILDLSAKEAYTRVAKSTCAEMPPRRVVQKHEDVRKDFWGFRHIVGREKIRMINAHESVQRVHKRIYGIIRDML